MPQGLIGSTARAAGRGGLARYAGALGGALSRGLSETARTPVHGAHERSLLRATYAAAAMKPAPRSPFLLSLVWSLVLGACGVDSPPQSGRGESASAGALVAEPLDASQAVGLYPHLSGGALGSAALTWTERRDGSGHRLRASSITNGKVDAPVTVADGEGWFVNWADVPRLALGADGRWAATWLEQLGEGTYAYGVRFALSADGGRSWGAPRWLHSDRSATEHGFASLAPLPGGRFAAVWLDGRQMASGQHGDPDPHGGHGAGDMALFCAVIEADGEVSGETRLDERVCECCPTALVRLDDGTLVVAYRDRGPDELRDIAIVRGRADEPAAWSTPRAVHADGWRMPGCPVNGPALAARGPEVACLWFTLGADDTPRVFVARSTDGGRSFGPPRRIDGGNPIGRVALAALPAGGWVAIHLEQTDAEWAEWRARALDADLEPGPTTILERVPAGRATGYPALAAGAGGLVAAWTDPSGPGIRVRTLRTP